MGENHQMTTKYRAWLKTHIVRNKLEADFQDGRFRDGVYARSDIRFHAQVGSLDEFPPPVADPSGRPGGWYNIQVFVPSSPKDEKRDKALARIAEIERELKELKKEV